MSKIRRTKTKTLFYTERPDSDSLVFAPPKVAEYVSAIHHALEATTWGKFKALMPPKEYRRLLKNVQAGDLDRDNGAHEQTKLPSDDAPFDPAVWFPEWCDGDYPDWLQARQAEWLPKSILERFASYETSVLNGPFWNIDSAFEKDIVEELTREGFTVTRRDNLTFY